jgi:hypothetical protein
MMLALMVAAGAAAAPAPPAPPEGRVVEEIVAVVRNPPGAAPRLVTLTRLTAEARVVLVSRGATEAAFRPLDEEALRAALGWLLDETVVADEFARLRLQEPDAAALSTQLQAFRAAFAGPAEYARFLAEAELSDAEVAAVLLRSLRARRFLESRFGRGAAVDDDEVDAYLVAHGASARTAAAREVARDRIAGERAASQARALLADLRARADIRVLVPALAPRGAPGVKP